MPRYRNGAGVVVNVPEEKARLIGGLTRIDAAAVTAWLVAERAYQDDVTAWLAAEAATAGHAARKTPSPGKTAGA